MPATANRETHLSLHPQQDVDGGRASSEQLEASLPGRLDAPPPSSREGSAKALPGPRRRREPGPKGRRVLTTCPRDCPDTCGIVVTVEEGRMVSHVGDPTHPVTQGFLCYKGRTFLKHHYHPERVLSPMRRGPDGWERISWDAALELAEKNLRRCLDTAGPLSIFFGTYSGLRELAKLSTARRFFAALGGATLMTGGTCTEALDLAQERDFGGIGAHDLRDVALSQGVVVWGRNPAVTHLHQMPFIRQARAAGAPLLVIDPLKTATARLADRHLALRPGSDGLLALGVARALLERGAIDWDFVANHTLGFEDFRRLAMRQTLSEVALGCDLSIADVEALAELYATRRPAATLLGLGLSYYRQSVANVRLVDAVVALSGNLGLRGGGVSGDMSRLKELDSAALLGPPMRTRWLRQPSLADEILSARDPELGMALFAGANPVATAPDGERIGKAIRTLPFVMVIDQFLTATADCAHLFLPCTTYLEESDVAASYGHALLGPVTPALEGLGEARSDITVFRLLAERLNVGHALADSLEGTLERILSPLSTQGVTLERIRQGAMEKRETPKVPFAEREFFTPSRRVELITSHEVYLEPIPPPYLRLLATKTDRMLNAQSLPEDLPAEAIIRVHSRAAARLGLEAGAEVRVASRVGAVVARLEVDELLREDVALLNPARWRGELLGVNRLREPLLTEEGSGAAMHETLVQLTRV